MGYGNRVEEARSYAQKLTEQIPQLAGVVLGGSLSNAPSRPDQFSDLDLFAYLSGSELPSTKTLAEQMEVDVAHLRRWGHLIAYRQSLETHDIDIKFFSIEYMRSLIAAKPSLDEQYLEDIECYQHVKLLSDRNDQILPLLQRAQATKAGNLETLGNLIFDRYGKAICWAILQGLQRSDRTAAAISLEQAINSLLCLLYITAGDYPPSIKWRGNRRFLSTVENGERFYQKLCEWIHLSDDADLAAKLRALQELETIVAGDCTRGPWRYREPWWLSDYEIIDRTTA